MFHGLGMNLGNLSQLSDAVTRSVSSENPTGEKGKGGMSNQFAGDSPSRELGVGWKVSPYSDIQPGETLELANIDGSGAVQHIWLTPAWLAPTENWRFAILRVYYEGSELPSVECPIGDFFASAIKPDDEFAPVNSLPVCVNPGSAFNCYWEMPFRKNIRITVENLHTEIMRIFYQIDYTLTQVPEECGYFHAQYRRVNPIPYKEVYTVADGIKGQGHYVGTYLLWGVNNNGWWGEGEIKFYMDGDTEYPTICGTGTEDYFCGSYNFDFNGYQKFTTAYAGLPYFTKPDGLYRSQQRFSLYRWHIMDPVRFQQDLRVTIQALGWRSGGRFMPLQDDISSVAFWYQDRPAPAGSTALTRDELEII